MTFVWKIPLDHNQRCTEKSLQLVNGIRSLIPIYHTRSREFYSRFGLACKIPLVILHEVYHSLTGDASAVPNPDIVGHLQALIE